MKKLCVFLVGLLLAGFAAQAQAVRITGTVTGSEDGMPLPGVSVVVKGTTIGAATDFDGKYDLNAPATAEVLTVSFIGYVTREVVIGGRTVIDVVLDPETMQLEEVVVTGYSSRKREVVSAAVTTIGGEKLRELPSTTSIDNMLQGKAAGVEATALNGKPGQTATVRVRGAVSLNLVGGDKALPLYVVDGMPLSPGDMNAINPNDILSVSMLKDAAASAIYGSRGANGVVVITTRKGEEGTSSISYSGRYGVAHKTPDPFEMMSAEENLEYEIAAGLYPATDLTPELKALLLSREHDWQEDILGAAEIVSHTITATGATGAISYYLSGAYDKNSGIIRELDGFKRYSARMNLASQVKPFIKLGMNFAVAHTQSDEPRDFNNAQNPFRAMYDYKPYEPVYVLDDDNNYALDENGNRQWNVAGTNGFHVIEGMRNAPNTDYNTKLLGTAFVDITLREGLQYTSRFTGNYGTYRGTLYTKPFSVLDGYVGDPDMPGSREEGGSQRFQYGWLNQLNWNRTFAEIHNVHLYAFSEFTRMNTETYNFSKKGFPSPDVEVMDAASTVLNARGARTEWALFSLAGGADYDFEGRYLLSSSIRRDGASRFGADNRYGWFWSVSGGWNLAKESFMAATSDWLNKLKVSASYGILGNWEIPNYAARGYYVFSDYNNRTSAVPTDYASNPSLSWERQNSTNLGVELSALGNLLNANVDYFVNRRDGFLFSKDLPWEMGGYKQYINAGKIRTNGLELSLSGTILRDGDFLWSASANITLLNYRVGELAGEEEIELGEVVIREGETPFTFYLPRYAGVNPANGNPLYLDAEGNPSEDYNYGNMRQFLRGKSTLPKGFGGFGTNVRWRGADFSADFSYKYGNYIMNYMAQSMISDGAGAMENQRKDALDYWKKPGDNKLPALNSGADAHESDRWLQNASYLRLRSVVLGYTLPQTFTAKYALEQVRVFVQAQNLFTITGYEGDPEISIGSGESQLGSDQAFVSGAFALYSYPQVRTFTFGVDIKF